MNFVERVLHSCWVTRATAIELADSCDVFPTFGSKPTTFSEASIIEPCRFASVIKTDYHISPLRTWTIPQLHSCLIRHFFSSEVPTSIATPWIQSSFTSWFHVPIYFRLTFRIRFIAHFRSCNDAHLFLRKVSLQLFWRQYTSICWIEVLIWKSRSFHERSH